MEKLWNLKIKKITLSARDIDKINNLVYYGAHFVAQREYEFIGSTYDEDAGVFTDYGMNNTARTWATSALVQMLTVCLHDDVQRSILSRILGDEYESDGHYTGQKRQEYIEKRIVEIWMDRKTLRQTIDKLMDLRNTETLRVYVKRIQGKKNEP